MFLALPITKKKKKKLFKKSKQIVDLKELSNKYINDFRFK